MNISTTEAETATREYENPGLQLAHVRQQKGYTVEYVASELHLRVRVIELLEAGDFNALPEVVFVKGYLRAYSKLLGIAADPLISMYERQLVDEHKPERTLWQSKRESHKGEHAIRWVTLVFAVGVLVAVGVWWHKNRDSSEQAFNVKETKSVLALKQEETEQPVLNLTDLSKMRSVLNPKPQMTPLENEGA